MDINFKSWENGMNGNQNNSQKGFMHSVEKNQNRHFNHFIHFFRFSRYFSFPFQIAPKHPTQKKKMGVQPTWTLQGGRVRRPLQGGRGPFYWQTTSPEPPSSWMGLGKSQRKRADLGMCFLHPKWFLALKLPNLRCDICFFPGWFWDVDLQGLLNRNMKWDILISKPRMQPDAPLRKCLGCSCLENSLHQAKNFLKWLHSWLKKVWNPIRFICELELGEFSKISPIFFSGISPGNNQKKN